MAFDSTKQCKIRDIVHSGVALEEMERKIRAVLDEPTQAERVETARKESGGRDRMKRGGKNRAMTSEDLPPGAVAVPQGE